MSKGTHFLGIDGGGSNTRALLTNAQHDQLAEGSARGCNPHNVGYEEAGLQIDAAVQTCLAALPNVDANIVSAYLGIAGIRDESEQAQLATSLRAFIWYRNASTTISHDLSIAYEAALSGVSGICLIAGTGAACIGKRTDGSFYRASNRASNGNEPGSGYAIGLDAINAGLVADDSRDRQTIAQLAETVIQRAESGNALAKQILETHSIALVELATQLSSEANLENEAPIALSGSLATSDSIFGELIDDQLKIAFPGASVIRSVTKPVEAAAALAVEQFNGERNDASN